MRGSGPKLVRPWWNTCMDNRQTRLPKDPIAAWFCSLAFDLDQHVDDFTTPVLSSYMPGLLLYVFPASKVSAFRTTGRPNYFSPPLLAPASFSFILPIFPSITPRKHYQPATSCGSQTHNLRFYNTVNQSFAIARIITSSLCTSTLSRI
jgi:hypothetical protein